MLYISTKKMIEFIENNGIQYIDTGIAPDPNLARPAPIKVFGCKLYDGSKLINNFRPCKNAEGVEGMYDLICKEFVDRETFEQMMLEHFERADEIKVFIGSVEEED